MSEEITIETIDEKIELLNENCNESLGIMDDKLDTIIEKEDQILSKLDEHTTVLTNILNKINELGPGGSDDEDEDEEVTSDFKTELLEKINQGIPYDQVKDWVIQTLTEQGIYSEADMVIKIFTHHTGDIILEFKVRPYHKWGKAIQFFQDNMGDADYFETSRYNMKNVLWYRLTKNQQMEDMHSNTDIVDDVTEQWGDKDDIDFGK